MSMYTQRLRVLITSGQRRRFDAEAKRRGSRVATIVRDAIDTTLSGTTHEERIRAVETIKAMKGKHQPVEEIEAATEGPMEAPCAAVMDAVGQGGADAQISSAALEEVSTSSSGRGGDVAGLARTAYAVFTPCSRSPTRRSRGHSTSISPS